MENFDYGYSFAKLGNDDRVYVYVNIPKNASCFLKTYWEGSVNVNFKKDMLPDDAIFVVALRDPIRRWISGFAQEKHMTVKSSDAINWDQVFNNPIATSHTEPQIKFVQGLNFDQVVWFKFEDDLQGNLDDFLFGKWRLHKTVDLESMHRNGIFNVSADDRQKSNIISAAKLQLRLKSHYLDQLNEVYKDDIELYNRVKYYSKES